MKVAAGVLLGIASAYLDTKMETPSFGEVDLPGDILNANEDLEKEASKSKEEFKRDLQKFRDLELDKDELKVFEWLEANKTKFIEEEWPAYEYSAEAALNKQYEETAQAEWNGWYEEKWELTADQKDFWWQKFKENAKKNAKKEEKDFPAKYFKAKYDKALEKKEGELVEEAYNKYKSGETQQ